MRIRNYELGIRNAGSLNAVVLLSFAETIRRLVLNQFVNESMSQFLSIPNS
jgi:hypothetical protein